MSSLNVDPYIALVGNLFVKDDEDIDDFNPTALNQSELMKSTVSLSPIGKVLSEETSVEIEKMILSTELTDGELVTREIAKAAKVDFYRVSAYNGYGIMNMFECVAKRLLKRESLPTFVEEPTVLPLKPSKKRYCFCFPRI